MLLNHPYDSFDPVVEFIEAAAEDPDVLAIKQTLYRTSGKASPIMKALARAAENGKQVTVLLELTARFDEDRNIDWARDLEDAGAHVLYGVAGLKVHAKIALVVRREPAGIRRYVHLGTGNYNERTARLYTDIGLLTAADDFGRDASGVFNTITGYSELPVFNQARDGADGDARPDPLADPQGGRPRPFRAAVGHTGQDELARRSRDHPGTVRGEQRRRADQAQHTRDLLPQTRRNEPERKHPGGLHRRPLP